MSATQAVIFNEKTSQYHYLEYPLDYSLSIAEIKNAKKRATSIQNATIDLVAFKQLSVHQQDHLVGRTKVDDIELSGSAMPNDSHLSRTDVAVDGEAMKIHRRCDSYGSATEQGLYFLALSCQLRHFSVQLERMLGMTNDGIHDQLFEY